MGVVFTTIVVIVSFSLLRFPMGHTSMSFFFLLFFIDFSCTRSWEWIQMEHWCLKVELQILVWLQDTFFVCFQEVREWVHLHHVIVESFWVKKQMVQMFEVPLTHIHCTPVYLFYFAVSTLFLLLFVCLFVFIMWLLIQSAP